MLPLINIMKVFDFGKNNDGYDVDGMLRQQDKCSMHMYDSVYDNGRRCIECGEFNYSIEVKYDN